MALFDSNPCRRISSELYHRSRSNRQIPELFVRFCSVPRKSCLLTHNSIVAWGICLGCHAACKDFTGLVIVRTLLGIFESACQPAFVVLSAMWYKREEQASAVTYW